ncbi:MAG: hypothetical protein EHM63_03675 [Actinobacteria bacterium]|nr:MAG: hypothetical protein EHM63_03675 [Actinomycetota bacterium]
MSASPCPNDHQQLVEDLRRLPSTELGRLLEPLMPSALSGDAGRATLAAIALVGSVLQERKGPTA